MRSSSELMSLALSQLPQLMIAIGVAVGAVIVFTKQAALGQRASLLGGLSLSLFALGHFASVGQSLMIRQIAALDRPWVLFSIMSIAFSVMHVAAIGLMIAALFARRPAPGPTVL